jgi:hypothetical protein
VWTSVYFGNDKVLNWYTKLEKNLKATDEEWKKLSQESWFKKAKEIAEEKRFFHWELEFPEVVFEGHQRKENPGFDALVGNPPWVLEIEPILKGYLKKTYPKLGGKPDLYRAFIEKSIYLTRGNGNHSFVCPNTFLAIPSALKLREHILEKLSVMSIVKLPTGAFPEVNANVVIYALCNAPPTPNLRARIYDWSVAVSKKPLSHVPIDEWVKSSSKVVEIELTKKVGGILDKINHSGRKLADSYEYVLGLQVYHNTIHSEEEIKNRIFHSSYQKDITYKPELGGKHVTSYGINFEGFEWVKITDRCYSCPPEKFFRGKRILIREISGIKGIVAGYCEDSFYSNKSTIIVRNSEESLCSLPYLVALLNSSILGYYFRLTAPKSAQDLFPRVSLTTVHTLPIRCISFVTPKQDRNKLLHEAKDIYKKYLENGNLDTILYFVESRLAKEHQPDAQLVQRHNADFLNKDWQISEKALWEQSDVVHDILAFLAEQMIEMNNEKQGEIKGFLGWLESQLKIQSDKKGKTGIEALTGKTQIKNYLGDYQKGKEYLSFEALWKILEKNRSRIPANLKSRELFDAVKSEYEKSIPKLLSLKEILRQTDWLVDQIVYKLYGLNEEEIKLVEKSG